MERQRGSRSWCFTLNHYVAEDEAHLAKVECQYLVYGREVGPTNGVPHLQGYIYFREAKPLLGVKRVLGPRYHLEPRKGTTSQATEYCKKDGDFTERGKITIRQGADDSFADVIKLAEAGDLETIKSEYPRLFLTHFKTIMSLRAFCNVPLSGDLEHEWWYGPTGTGKSRAVWQRFPEHYAKSVNKWWDGYYGQDTVVIEEWEPKNEMTAAKLKIWGDRYPFPAEIKGGTIQKVRPKKIIITSNYSIDQCFPNAEDREPLKRRFKQVYFPFQVDGPPLPPATPPPKQPEFVPIGPLEDLNTDDFYESIYNL